MYLFTGLVLCIGWVCGWGISAFEVTIIAILLAELH